jgi:hypothetical protein
VIFNVLGFSVFTSKNTACNTYHLIIQIIYFTSEFSYKLNMYKIFCLTRKRLIVVFNASDLFRNFCFYKQKFSL